MEGIRWDEIKAEHHRKKARVLVAVPGLGRGSVLGHDEVFGRILCEQDEHVPILRNRNALHSFAGHARVTFLEDLIIGMEIPTQRLHDEFWMERNLGFRNRDHPNYDIVMALLRSG